MDNTKQTMTLVNRERLTLNGVNNVESFDDEFLALSTERGRVCVEGENLKIESLSKDGGDIMIVGKVSGVYYSDEPTKTKGIFGRMFK